MHAEPLQDRAAVVGAVDLQEAEPSLRCLVRATRHQRFVDAAAPPLGQRAAAPQRREVRPFVEAGSRPSRPATPSPASATHTDMAVGSAACSADTSRTRPVASSSHTALCTSLTIAQSAAVPSGSSRSRRMVTPSGAGALASVATAPPTPRRRRASPRRRARTLPRATAPAGRPALSYPWCFHSNSRPSPRKYSTADAIAASAFGLVEVGPHDAVAPCAAAPGGAVIRISGAGSRPRRPSGAGAGSPRVEPAPCRVEESYAALSCRSRCLGPCPCARRLERVALDVLADPGVHRDRGGGAGVDRAGRAELRDRADSASALRVGSTAPDPPGRRAARSARGSARSRAAPRPAGCRCRRPAGRLGRAHASERREVSWWRTCW